MTGREPAIPQRGQDTHTHTHPEIDTRVSSAKPNTQGVLIRVVGTETSHDGGWRQFCQCRRRPPAMYHDEARRSMGTRPPSQQCWQSNPECVWMEKILPVNIAEGAGALQAAWHITTADQVVALQFCMFTGKIFSIHSSQSRGMLASGIRLAPACARAAWPLHARHRTPAMTWGAPGALCTRLCCTRAARCVGAAFVEINATRSLCQWRPSPRLARALHLSSYVHGAADTGALHSCWGMRRAWRPQAQPMPSRLHQSA